VVMGDAVGVHLQSECERGVAELETMRASPPEGQPPITSASQWAPGRGG